MAADASVVTPSTAPSAAPGSSDDPTRSKSLKRARETTPTPSPASVSAGDLSPAKIARLIGFTRQSHSPLSGAAALEDKRRRRAEEQRQGTSGSSPNPAQQALLDLMSGATAAVSRPQEARSVTGPSAVEAAAAAAARALGSVQIPAHTSAELQDGSPQSAVSAESGASLEDGESQVVHSPGQMDVDGRDDQRMYAPQPEAQMEDKAASSLSYPGLQGAAMAAPAAPQRGMSLPTTDSQNPDMAPRSPSKKHKCPYCETEFTRHHNLKSHLLTHSQEKPYVCGQCQMRFRRLHDLKRHSKLHTGEKPHICPKCDRKFARGDALARHSKGAGGCAGRRPSMGSFAGDEDYEGGSMADGDDSAMTGVLYDNSADTSMTEEERRRLSLPSIKAQHVAGQAPQEGFAAHSNTYPPTGPRPAGGLYPPNVDRGSTGSTTSPSVPNSHTPHTSISSMPLSAGSSSMYSQSGMTESPKPLSPAGAQTNQAGQKRASSNQQPASGLSLPSHGMSPAAKQAWLSQYPPADGRQPEGNAAAPTTGRGRGRGASGTTQRQASNGTGPSENNMFAPADPAFWAYFQHLDEKVKQLTAGMEASNKREAQLMDKVTAHEQHISVLAAEVATLRQQLSGTQEDAAGQE